MIPAAAVAAVVAAVAVAVVVAARLTQKAGAMVEARAKVQVLAEAGAEGSMLFRGNSCSYRLVNIC